MEATYSVHCTLYNVLLLFPVSYFNIHSPVSLVQVAPSETGKQDIISSYRHLPLNQILDSYLPVVGWEVIWERVGDSLNTMERGHHQRSPQESPRLIVTVSRRIVISSLWHADVTWHHTRDLDILFVTSFSR